MDIYEPLKNFTDNEINIILEKNILEDLLILPISVGEYHPDWKYAQDLCVKLALYNNNEIRANAILGLSYIARTKGKLQKDIIEPIILKELIENKENKGRIIDAIVDINLFMHWNIKYK